MVHGVVFIFMLVIIGFLIYAISDARKGKLPYIRTIAGLQAVDEAIGRATEMGKPILYVSGLGDVNDVQTLASLSILSNIAQKAATYDTSLIMPNIFSVTMAAAQEVVKEAHLRAGRPDTFKPDNIYYVSDEQFAFVAHLNGLMERLKPAANFYMGRFFAESLILAETGHRTGAIQIAGTAEASQLPFFVVACDYCLIGEELYAASAYLSKDPGQMGSIRAQDLTKLLAFALIIIGCITQTMAQWIPSLHWLAGWLGG